MQDLNLDLWNLTLCLQPEALLLYPLKHRWSSSSPLPQGATLCQYSLNLRISTAILVLKPNATKIIPPGFKVTLTFDGKHDPQVWLFRPQGDCINLQGAVS